jgi:hypothetical protein
LIVSEKQLNLDHWLITFGGFLGKTGKVNFNGRISHQILKKHCRSYILGQAFDSGCKRFFSMQNNENFQFLGLSHMENENMTPSLVIPSHVPHKTPEKVGAS